MTKKLHIFTLVTLLTGSLSFMPVKGIEPISVEAVVQQTNQPDFWNRLYPYFNWKNGLIGTGILGFAYTLKYLYHYSNDLKFLSQIDEMLSTSSLEAQNIEKKFRISGLNLSIHGKKGSTLPSNLSDQIDSASTNDKIYSSETGNKIKLEAGKTPEFKSNIRRQIAWEKNELLSYLQKLSFWSNAPGKIFEKFTISSSTTPASSSTTTTLTSAANPSSPALVFTGSKGVTFSDHQKVLKLIEENSDSPRLVEDMSILPKFITECYGLFTWNNSISSIYLAQRYNKAFDLYIALFQRYVQIIKLERAMAIS